MRRSRFAQSTFARYINGYQQLYENKHNGDLRLIYIQTRTKKFLINLWNKNKFAISRQQTFYLSTTKLEKNVFF